MLTRSKDYKKSCRNQDRMKIKENRGRKRWTEKLNWLKRKTVSLKAILIKQRKK